MNPKRKTLSMFIFFFPASLLPQTKFLDTTHDLLRGSKTNSQTCPPSRIYLWPCALKGERGLKCIWVKTCVVHDCAAVLCVCTEWAPGELHFFSYRGKTRFVSIESCVFLFHQSRMMRRGKKSLCFSVLFQADGWCTLLIDFLNKCN